MIVRWWAVVAACAASAAGCSGPEKDDPAPPPPTYSISGVVSGDAVTGVTVSLQGDRPRTTTTNELGQYSFRGLANGSYMLSPALDGYTFSPTSRAVTLNGGDVTAQDFTSQLVPPPAPSWAIAGAVTGDGPAGATMTLVGPAPSTSTRIVTSDADGSYLFPSVVSGVYLLTPARAGGWTFHPANALVTMAGTRLTGPDFVSIAPTHGLSGRITGGLAAGVFVTLSGDLDAVTVTTASGGYAFGELPPGNYVVTPSYAGFAFTPPSRTVAMSTATVAGQDFVAAPTHKIAGRVGGAVSEGVNVSLAGGATATAVTDASGYYEFADLVDGSYVVRPGSAGYAFGPTQRSVTLAGANVLDADFAASSTPPATYTVSGSVSGAIQRGVRITLQGNLTSTATTDPAGAFAFDAVSPGEWLVIPSHDDYTFDPASRFVVVRDANLSGQAFTAAAKPSARTISGTIAGDAAAGVAVRLEGPAPGEIRTTSADAEGNFAFRGLGDGLYLATPSRPGFAFTPADCLVRVAGPSVTFLEFTSARAPHSVSGKVTGPVVAGVAVALTGGAVSLTTLTAGDGTFTFTGLADGTYTVEPSLPGYYSTPSTVSVSLAGVDATGVDFELALAHSISGYVSGDVTGGVKVKLSGVAAGEVTTDPAGYFEFTDLRDGGYLLEASLEGYRLDPRSLSIELVGADVGTASFTSTLIPTYAVSGTVAGSIQAGVTVTLAGGGATWTTTTGGAGTYVFTGLPNASYMVIPSVAGHAFTPASRAFRIDDADVLGQDFTSAPAP